MDAQGVPVHDTATLAPLEVFRVLSGALTRKLMVSMSFNTSDRWKQFIVRGGSLVKSLAT